MAYINKNNSMEDISLYDDDLYIGIEFVPVNIMEDNVELKPIDFIVGIYSDDLDEFVDERGISYKSINDISDNSNIIGNKFFGFPIEFNKLKENYDGRNYSYSREDCSYEYYFDVCKYVFKYNKSEKNDKKEPIISMIDLVNNRSYIIDISSDFFDAYKSKKEINPNKQQDGMKTFEPIGAYKYITSRVIGQDDQVSELVNAVFLNQKYGKYEGIKTNILIMGPSGSGKTEMIRSLSKYANIPMVVEDATKYTSSGYVGANVLDILTDLYKRSGKNLTLAEKGIIVLDEVDKMCTDGYNKNHVRKNDVQEELLTLLEGNSFCLDDYGVEINTKGITFILCGAFSKLTNITNRKNSVGFIDNSEERKKLDITTEDLSSYGMMIDLLRRLPIRIITNELTKDNLKEILVKSDISNLKIYEKVLRLEDNVRLVYDDGTLDAIVDKAMKFKGGASGLHSVVTTTLLDAIKSVNSLAGGEKELIISKETVETPSKYLIKRVEKGVGNGKNKLSESYGEYYS